MSEQQDNILTRAFDWCYQRPTLLFRLLLVLCGGLLLADFMYTKHGHFAFENAIGFFAGYGFFAYCFIVLSAKALRKLIKRNETYYDH